MDLLELMTVRLVLCIMPYVLINSFDSYTKEDIQFWLLIIPSLWSILISTLLPKTVRWIFRYLVPFWLCSFLSKIDYAPFDLVSQTTNYKKIFIDSLIYTPYPAFILLFESFQRELYSIVTIFLFRLFRWLLRYGCFKIFLYILICIINACIFTALILIVIPLIDYRYYVHKSSISVESKAQPRDVDYDLPELQRYESHGSYEIFTGIESQFNGSFAYIDGKRTPICRKMFFRVPGEDIDITCSTHFYRIILDDQAMLDDQALSSRNLTFYWRRNGMSMNITRHLQFRRNNVLHYQIKSLRQDDFDTEISLWAEKQITIGYKPSLIRLKIGYFFIHLQREIEHYVHIPNGHILVLKNMQFYALSSSEEIVAFHHISSISDEKINGEITSVCKRDFDGCSPYVHYVYNKTSTLYFQKSKINQVTVTLNETIFQGHSISCICENAYGKHKILVQVHQFVDNNSSEKPVIAEIQLPYLFVILPVGLTTYSKQKYEKLRKDVSEKISENKDWRHSFQFFIDDEVNFYFYMHIFEKIIIFVTACEMVMILIITTRLYNFLFVNKIAKFILVRNPKISEAENCVCNFGTLMIAGKIEYDMMLVYNEEEYGLVKNVFVPYFERRGLSVFVTDRDASFGMSNASSSSSAVQSSRIFVVLVTQNFLRDQWNNEFVVGTNILSMIHEREGHHLIVIKWNDVEVPTSLRWDKKVTIIEWSERRTLSDNMLILRNRLQSIPCISKFF